MSEIEAARLLNAAIATLERDVPELAVAGYIFSPYLQLDGSELVMKLLSSRPE